MTELSAVTLFINLYAEHIMRNAGLDELQAGIKVGGGDINNLRYEDNATLMAKSEEELKSLLMNVEEESEKAGLNLNIQKTHGIWSHHFMANRRGKVEAMQIFFSWAPKSLWTVTIVMKLKDICFLKESYDKPRQCIQKQKYHFANKDPYCQSYGFSSSSCCRIHGQKNLAGYHP